MEKRSHVWQLNNLFIVLLLGLTGCGLGISNESNDDIARQKNWRQLKAEYQKVSGTYEGLVEYTTFNESKTYDGRITLNTFVSLEGRTKDGKPIQKPSLKGRFRLKEIVQNIDYKDFEVFYEPQNNGEFIMVYEPQGGEALAADPTNIVGRLTYTDQKKIIKAKIIQSNAVVAKLTMTYLGPSVSSVDEKVERFKRLEKMYEPLTGEYLNNYGPGGKSWACKIQKTPSFSLCGPEDGIEFQVKISQRREIVDSLNGRIYLSSLYAHIKLDWHSSSDENQKNDDEKKQYFMEAMGPVEYSPFTHTIDFSGAIGGTNVFIASGFLKNGVLEWDPINNRRGPWLRFRGFHQ